MAMKSIDTRHSVALNAGDYRSDRGISLCGYHEAHGLAPMAIDTRHSVAQNGFRNSVTCVCT